MNTAAENSARMIRESETRQRTAPRSVSEGHQSKIPFRPGFVPIATGADSSYTSRDGFGSTQFNFGATPTGEGSSQAVFGCSQYSIDQIASLQARLSRKLGPEYITQRPGPGGGPKLSYVEGWKVLSLANEVFGFNGWSSSIVNLCVDFIESDKDGRHNVGVSSIVRVTLRDGVFHEDLGYGEAINVKSRSAALEKAKKEAATDGLKRALKNFGNVLGLCLYDKDYTKEVVKIKVKPVVFKPDELWRRPEFDENLQRSASAGPSRPHPLTSDAYNTMPTPGGGRSGVVPSRAQPDRSMPPPPIPCTPLQSVEDPEFDEFGDDSFLLDSNTSFDSFDMPPPPALAAKPVAKQETPRAHVHQPSHLAQTTPTTPAPQPRLQQSMQTPAAPAAQPVRSVPPPSRAVSAPHYTTVQPASAHSATADSATAQPITLQHTPPPANGNNVDRSATSPSNLSTVSGSSEPSPHEKIGGFVMPDDAASKGSAARKRAIEAAKLHNAHRDPLRDADSNKRQRV